jgi:hypothetical protein
MKSQLPKYLSPLPKYLTHIHNSDPKIKIITLTKSRLAEPSLVVVSDPNKYIVQPLSGYALLIVKYCNNFVSNNISNKGTNRFEQNNISMTNNAGIYLVYSS